jgi:hypothetical protein
MWLRGKGPLAAPGAVAGTGNTPQTTMSPAMRWIMLNLAATPMTAATRQLGYAWSRWRPRHQARARYYHYQARLRAALT